MRIVVQTVVIKGVIMNVIVWHMVKQNERLCLFIGFTLIRDDLCGCKA